MKNHIGLSILLVLISGGFLFAQETKQNMPWIDISAEKGRISIIGKGTPELYNGHPTTVMMSDNTTIYCTWSYDHGGKLGFLSVSRDGGLTWDKMEVPKDWSTMRNCPSIYNLQDSKGKERLFIFAAQPNMSQTYSEDGGKTWSAVKSLNKPCIMAFASIIKLSNGDYLGMYHRGENNQDGRYLTLWQSISKDGGLTWSESVKVGEMEGRAPCEPFVFRSNNGKRLICVARENNRVGNSLMMFSDDEGVSWTSLKETPWGLTGDRHIIKPTGDGRLIAVFRDMAPNSPTKGHFVAWVGFEKDLRERTSGQYKIKLLHSYAGSDCGYPGLEILPDGTIVAITYNKMMPTADKHSVVAVRFKLAEIDRRL
ncbi:MAG: sialidase family protein [Bacteroidales bacterium]